MLIVAATPLGNPGDASPRLAAALREADVVAAEDTRRLRRLADNLGVAVSGRVVSHWDAVERERLPGLLAELRCGATVLLVSDAGMPMLSDPGYVLVSSAAAEGVPVTVLPGPSAVTAALAVAGLPADRFCFEGFLPRKRGARRREIGELAPQTRTMVFFEAPHRVTATLADMRDLFGADRDAAVCRELTKTYEEVRRAALGELADWAAQNDVRGEITLVVSGHAASSEEPDENDTALVAEVVDEVESQVAAGASRRDAVSSVAALRGLPRRFVYRVATLPRSQ